MPDLPKVPDAYFVVNRITVDAETIDFDKTYTFEFSDETGKVSWHGIKPVRDSNFAYFILPGRHLTGLMGVEAIGVIEPKEFGDSEIMAAGAAIAEAAAPVRQRWDGFAPSIGRIVHYRLSKRDAEIINKRRTDAQDHMHTHRERATGVMVHVGSPANEGEDVAMIVTRVGVYSEHAKDGPVSGHCILDGSDTYWVRGAAKGNNPGEWHWPERV